MRTPWVRAPASSLSAEEEIKILAGFNRSLAPDGTFEASGLAPAELLALWMAGFAPTEDVGE